MGSRCLGPNWLFAARTGGANETHWIDDLSIDAVCEHGTPWSDAGFDNNAGWISTSQVTDIEEAGVDSDTINVTSGR